jgi:hypothetical protein
MRQIFDGVDLVSQFPLTTVRLRTSVVFQIYAKRALFERGLKTITAIGLYEQSRGVDSSGEVILTFIYIRILSYTSLGILQRIFLWIYRVLPLLQ